MPLVGRKSLTVSIPFDSSGRIATPTLSSPANGGVALTRIMQQLYPDKPERQPLKFFFPHAISSFQHEMASVGYEELPRPLSLPLLDTSGAQLNKVSIEFVVARPLDGIFTPVEAEIAVLRDIAASDTPVIFSNVHDSLGGAWKINAFSLSIARTDEIGRTVQATASMSLTESTDRLERFILLPKFSYRVPKGTGGGGADKDKETTATAESVWSKFRTKIADKYTITNAEKDTLNKLIEQKGASAVLSAISLPGTKTYRPATVIDHVMKAFVKTGKN